MKYAVADIAVALDSVSQMCDAGATVVFTAAGGYIELSNKERITFKRRGDTYYREAWVPRHPDAAPFTGQGPRDP